jgi:hypothetical protein
MSERAAPKLGSMVWAKELVALQSQALPVLYGKGRPFGRSVRPAPDFRRWRINAGASRNAVAQYPFLSLPEPRRVPTNPLAFTYLALLRGRLPAADAQWLLLARLARAGRTDG